MVRAFRSKDAEAALRAARVPAETIYVSNLGHGFDDVILNAGALLLKTAYDV